MSERRVLPQRRYAESLDLRHGDQNYSISIGFFADGTPAEIFVNAAKVGSGAEAIARDAAVLLSIAMQFSVPLEVMSGAITREHSGAASSVIGAVLDLLSNQPRGVSDAGVQSQG